jgi:hypothetical protein
MATQALLFVPCDKDESDRLTELTLEWIRVNGGSLRSGGLLGERVNALISAAGDALPASI